MQVQFVYTRQTSCALQFGVVIIMTLLFLKMIKYYNLNLILLIYFENYIKIKQSAERLWKYHCYFLWNAEYSGVSVNHITRLMNSLGRLQRRTNIITVAT